MAAGQIPYGNTSTALQSSANLYWDNADVRLGVGTNSPVATLHVRGGNSNNAIVDNDGSQYTTMSWYNNGTVRAQGYYDASNIIFVFGTDVAAPLIFKANGTEGMRLASGGGVSIGTATGAGANNLLVAGTATATSFSGAGTGLTGTAASLTAGASQNITNSGGWSVTPSGTKLYFNYSGTDVASLDSSGNFIVLANVTAYGTP